MKVTVIKITKENYNQLGSLVQSVVQCDTGIYLLSHKKNRRLPLAE